MNRESRVFPGELTIRVAGGFPVQPRIPYQSAEDLLTDEVPTLHLFHGSHHQGEFHGSHHQGEFHGSHHQGELAEGCGAGAVAS
jgi:hypothetical protein